MSTFTKQMWEAALWTFLETFIVTLGPSIAVVQVGNWGAFGGAAASALFSAAAAVLSILKSVAVRNLGAKDSPFISGELPEDKE